MWPTALFDKMQVILCLIQYVCQPIKISIQGLSREEKSGVGTQSSCITSSSLVSYAAVYVPIFTQLDDKNELRKWILPAPPHVPFK